MPAATPDVESTLADLVTHRPSSAHVLEILGLDYCCGGKRSLKEACAAKGLSPEEVLKRALSARPDSPTTEIAPATQSLTSLVENIVEVHHAFLRRELPRLAVLFQKVARVHGGNHPEILALKDTFDEFVSELNLHMMKEEAVLFPAIRCLDAGEEPSFCPGELRSPIRQLESDHEQAGAALHRMRAITSDYRLPQDVCESYKQLYQGLQRLESDMHMHVHKENNILFPQAAEAERRAGRARKG